MLEADAHLIGRVTYESFAGAWPERAGEFADKVNAMPKYVVTTTLHELLTWTPVANVVVSTPSASCSTMKSNAHPLCPTAPIPVARRG